MSLEYKTSSRLTAVLAAISVAILLTACTAPVALQPGQSETAPPVDSESTIAGLTPPAATEEPTVSTTQPPATEEPATAAPIPSPTPEATEEAEATRETSRRWQAGPVLVELVTTPGFVPPNFAWSNTPDLVLYAHGRAIVARVDYDDTEGVYRRTLLEGALPPAELCALLLEIEADGFFEVDMVEYKAPRVTDQGTTAITVRAWRANQISAYALPFAVADETRVMDPEVAVPPALASTFIRLSSFEPPGAQPYRPDRVAVLVAPSQSSAPAEPWPSAAPLLADLAASSAEDNGVVLEGEAATALYDRFAGAITRSYQDKGTTYAVTIRPLLPFERWGPGNPYTRQPYTYETTPTTEMECSGEPER